MFAQTSAGLVSMEAENFTSKVAQGGDSWNTHTATAGFSGSGAMKAEPDDEDGTSVSAANAPTGSPRLDFDVNFVSTGTHYVWILGHGDSFNDDSVHVGLNGSIPSTGQDYGGFTATGFGWDNSGASTPVTINVPSAGNHTFNVWMREDGVVVDKVIITTDPGFVPTGTGPAETRVFRQSAGLVSMEAEHFLQTVSQGGDSWSGYTATAGYSGSGAMQAGPDDEDGTSVSAANAPTGSPRLDFKVSFSSTGTHYVWIRGHGDSFNDDSVHVGLNGSIPAGGQDFGGFTASGYGWDNSGASTPVMISVPSAGVHTFSIWMREDGVVVDKVVITDDITDTFSGTGPAETL
jgi:hypothetical protein